MTAIYITLAVLAYLLIGSVVVGIGIRTVGNDNVTWVEIVLWPVWVLVGIVHFPLKFVIYLAKRIGGVK